MSYLDTVESMWAALRLRGIRRSTRGTSKSSWRFGAVLLAIAATFLFVLAVAVYYGYFPPSLVDNLTDGELGVLGFLAAAGAVGCEVAAERGS